MLMLEILDEVDSESLFVFFLPAIRYICICYFNQKFYSLATTLVELSLALHPNLRLVS